MKVFRRNKRERGVATILVVGVLVVFLIFFLVVAIDFAYIYVVRGQIQNAADAATMAGVVLISDPDDTVQTAARNEAIKFAAKNSAAGNPVVLDSNGSNILSSSNDITVGYWNGTGYERGSQPVNAMEVRPRRTQDSPGGSVGLIFGRLVDWPEMEVSRVAIATLRPLDISATPLCLPSCGRSTPLSTAQPNVTPGRRFFFREQDGDPNIGWSSFLDKNTSQPIISAYIRGTRVPPSICNECIFTTEGLVTPSLCEIRQRIREEGDTHQVNGADIFGWKVAIPILPETPCDTAKGTGCITGDPGYQPGDPYEVVAFAQVIITDAVPTGNCPGDSGPYALGNPGIVIVGTGPGIALINSTITCLDCNDPTAIGIDDRAKLVK